jgi:Glucose-6-phosphate dehydrogenase, C-terminal domain
MAENFGVAGRGAFYEQAGTIRDVVEHHLFQLLSNVAMEPPVSVDNHSLRDEKVKVLRAIRTLEPGDVVRGQFQGYRNEKGVNPESTVETYVALRLYIDSWRWKGVPFYIRAGKSLPVTATEVTAILRPPPDLFSDQPITQNYLRFRVSPGLAIAMGALVKKPGDRLRAILWNFSPPNIPIQPRCFLTKNCWMTPCTAILRGSPGRIMWKRLGGSCNRFSATQHHCAFTIPEPGARRKAKRWLHRTEGGVIRRIRMKADESPGFVSAPGCSRGYRYRAAAGTLEAGRDAVSRGNAQRA